MLVLYRFGAPNLYRMCPRNSALPFAKQGCIGVRTLL